MWHVVTATTVTQRLQPAKVLGFALGLTESVNAAMTGLIILILCQKFKLKAWTLK